MAGSLAPYVSPSPIIDYGGTGVVDLLNLAAAQGGAVEYAAQVFETDGAGNLGFDLTPYLVTGGGEIDYDSTADICATSQFTLDFTDSRLYIQPQWGAAMVQLYFLARHPQVNSGTWYRFPVGVYVVTTPGTEDLDAAEKVAVTGYEKTYLLQTEPPKTLSFAAGTTYVVAVRAVFRSLGLLGGSAALNTICSYPADWAVKTLPTAMTYPIGGNMTGLAIVNDLLAASAANPIYTTPVGFFQIDDIPVPASQALDWQWAGDFNPSQPAHFPASRIVVMHKQSYSGDVYNIPNEWAFVQDGLTFQPTHTDGSDGMYVVDNTSIPPSDQTSVGRILRTTATLQASGSADLIKQGNKLVTAALSAAEQITLTTRPWPVAWHYDVFQYSHPALPYTSLRRLQTQSWTLPLTGQSMTVNANVVASL